MQGFEEGFRRDNLVPKQDAGEPSALPEDRHQPLQAGVASLTWLPLPVWVRYNTLDRFCGVTLKIRTFGIVIKLLLLKHDPVPFAASA